VQNPVPSPVADCAIRADAPAELLYLAHCAPDAPDKGEKIRAYHQLEHLLARGHRVHLVCFARRDGELERVRALAGRCASIHVERLGVVGGLARAVAPFARGGSLTTAFHASRAAAAHVARLARDVRLTAAIAFSSAVAPLVPAGLPWLFDCVDVDSRTWAELGHRRVAGVLHRVEAARLRAVERRAADAAACTLVTTEHERELLLAVAPAARVRVLANGVDAVRIDPSVAGPRVHPRRFVAFVGQMDYAPNVDAVRWFAAEVWPAVAAARPELDFLVVGRDPARSVRALARPRVRVTGTVADVVPYLRDADAVVAPLRIARGVQNKVLEALVAGRRVYATPSVVAALGSPAPRGAIACRSAAELVAALTAAAPASGAEAAAIRAEAALRFSWPRALATLDAELARLRSPREGRRSGRCGS
jgi:sugar transferase (PEP-CTERM/EpsH1 system associated)